MTTPNSITVPSCERIVYDRMGSGPALILLHGIGGNRTNWTDQMIAFAPWFDTIAWDARGWGGSASYAGDLSIDLLVDDLFALMDALDLKQAHILGLSMGGLIAMRAAIRNPKCFSSLTLADTILGFGQLAAAQKQAFLDARLKPIIAGGGIAAIAEPVARSLAGPYASAKALSRLVSSMEALHEESYVKAMRMVAFDDTIIDARQITIPTHVIVGEHDPVTPSAMARELANTIPAARFSIVPYAGHLPNIEFSEAFDAIVLSYLLTLGEGR
jgi:3-oxoadipate enol-lactonase